LVERLFRFFDSLSVVRIDGVDDAVALGVVFIPKSLKLLLASQVPEIKPEKYKIFK
jgi:hypothetical protein